MGKKTVLSTTIGPSRVKRAEGRVITYDLHKMHKKIAKATPSHPAGENAGRGT